MASFDPGFVALRGTPEQTKAAAKRVQGLLRQGAGQDRGQLHDGPHRRLLRLRRAGQGAPVRALRQRRRGAAARPEAAAGRAAEPQDDGRLRGSRRVGAGGRAARGLRRLSALRIFFIAATSIWRMRSALTPYSAASSCSVMPPRAVVVDLQPALLDDAAAARVQHVQRLGDAVAGQPVAVARLDHARRLAGCRRPGRRSARSSPRRRRSAAPAPRRRRTGGFPSPALPRA